MHNEQHFAEVTPASNATMQNDAQQPQQGMQHQGVNTGTSNPQGSQSGMGQQQPAPEANPYYQAQGVNPYYQMQNTPYTSQPSSNPLSSYFGGINTTQLLTGALIGAAATYLLTNETVQKRLFKGIAAMGDIVSGGMDELKERYEDAKAEYEAGKGS